MAISKLLFFIPLLLLTFQEGLAQRKINTKKLDSIHLIVLNSKNTSIKINGLLELCGYYRKINTENLDSLSYYANKIILLTESDKKFENRKADALDHLAFVAYYRRENNLAKKYIKEYKEISEKNNYAVGLSNASYLSAYLSLDENDVNMYIYQLENAYQLAKEYNVPDSLIFKMGVGLSSAYSVYNFNSDLISNVLLELIDLVDSPEISLQDKGIFYLDLGTLYDKTNDDEKAKINYEKAIQLFKEDNNTYYLYAPLINLASYYQSKGKHHKAITIYKEALVLEVQESYTKLYYGLGSSFFSLKDYNKAENYFIKAKNEYISKNDLFGEADCLNSIGEIYRQKNATKQANFYFNLAIKKYLKDVDFKKKYNVGKSQITSSYSKISDIYRVKNNYKKSLEYHKLYANYKDSIAIEQNIKVKEHYIFFKTKNQKNNLIKNLETENKLQDIHTAKEQSYKIGLLVFTILILLLLVLAINRNRLKQRAIKKIEEKNEENNLLIREIHHRVKNNLQIISSLLGSKIDSNAVDETIKKILQESQNKIRSMAIIHQNLYQGNQYTKVYVNTYIKELIEQIKTSFKLNSSSIFFNLEIQDKEIPIGFAIPLGLILNELITNAYKYAFTNLNDKENRISISFHPLKNETKYRLIVKDNGKGLPKDFHVNSQSSFGLQMVYDLVAQLQGEVTIAQDKGTSFNIVLEEPKET